MLGIQRAEPEEVFHVHCVCQGGKTCHRQAYMFPATRWDAAHAEIKIEFQRCEPEW